MMFELTGEKRSGKKRRKTARGGKNEVEEERRKGGEGYHASGSKAVRHQYIPYSLLSATVQSTSSTPKQSSRGECILS